MDLNKKTEKNKVYGWDWILIIGLTVAPMNEFRVGKVGPGEALVLLWCMRYLGRFAVLHLNDLISRFWILFLPILALGTGYCMIIYPEEASPGGLATYLSFAFFSILIVVGMSDRTAEQIKSFIYTAGIVVACWYLYLLYYSEHISYYFYGATLWYHDTRFSGGANNPHQIATLLGAVLYFNIIHITDTKSSLLSRLMALISAFSCVYVSLQTKSSTLVVAIILTFALFLYYLALKNLKSKTQKWIATSVLIILFAVVVGVFREKLFDYIFEWIESDANGLGRLEIFATIGDTLRKNWIIGLGPGVHGMNGVIEYHNAYLEILAMSGVIGLGLFAFFSVRLFMLLMEDTRMVFCVVPLYVYGLGGFSMRRISFWIIVAVLVAYALRLRKERKTTDSGMSSAFSDRPGFPKRKAQS